MAKKLSDDFDKKPPADEAIESAVLACFLLHPGKFSKFSDKVVPDDFYVPANRSVFVEMLAVHKAKEPVEAKFLLPRLKKFDVQAGIVLGELVKTQPMVANLEHYIGKLVALGSQRRALATAERIIQAVHADLPTEELMREATKYSRKVPPQLTTLEDSTKRYLATLEQKRDRLVDLGIPDLDYALGGGVEAGEFVIFAARPSHGKSAIGLQMVHQWTVDGIPSMFISEEMPSLALGKRAMQFATETPSEHWHHKLGLVKGEVAEHFQRRAPCIIAESCRTAENAAEQIRIAVKEQGVRAVVVDYAQLLGSEGQKRYEQITNTSICLRQITNETGIVLVALCQLSREIEKRPKFEPKLSDLRETGQLEQDADVIVFCVWPWKIKPSSDINEYKFFIAKNRNRPINCPVLTCKFEPSRQRFVSTKPVLVPAQDEVEYVNRELNF